MLKGADSSLKQKLQLRNVGDYVLTSKSGCIDVDNIDDVAEFKETVQAMRTVGMSEEEVEDAFRVVAAILVLGQVNFSEDAKEQSQVSNKQETELAGKLLKVSTNSLEHALIYRTISSGSARASVYKCSNNKEQAIYTRDALCKGLYSRLFDWIVQKVNKAMYKQEVQTSVTIGILDIYGFEIFEENGFEQLCINYVNEKLQQIFIGNFLFFSPF